MKKPLKIYLNVDTGKELKIKKLAMKLPLS